MKKPKQSRQRTKRKGDGSVAARSTEAGKVVPSYRLTALPPKHPHHTPTANRRGR
jgi:hypothetical protein